MPEGFKLLDAYVEVSANATGVGEKVSRQFTGEIAPAAKKMADAVDSATQRVASASKRQADAVSSLKLARMRLSDVEKTAKEGSTQLVAAQDAVARAERNVSAAAEDAARAHRRLDTAQGQLRESGSRAGSSYLGGVKSSLSSSLLGGVIGGFTSGVTTGVVNLIGSAVSDIGGMLATVGTDIAATAIDFDSTLQSANIGFTTMLGSGQKAKGFIDDLAKFAQVTPFEFKGLISNAQQMMGMGIAAKDVIPDLTALGDAVASMGGTAENVNQVTLAFDQMYAKGKLDMGNIEQLSQGGVASALQVLADSYGKTKGQMIDMISTGQVMSADALPRLIKGLEHGTKNVAALGGMMDKQSHTFQGALSNIQDAFQKTSGAVLKPFFDVASGGMQRFATALSGKPAEKFTKDVTKTLAPFGKEIDKWIGHIDLGKIFKGVDKTFKDLAKEVNPKDFGKGLKDFTKFAKDIFGDITRIAPKVIKAIKEAAPAIGETIKSGVEFIGWIADVIDWFDKTEKAWNKWRKQFAKGMDGFFHDADRFWHDIGAGWDGFWAGIGASVTHGWDQIVGAFQHGGKQITDFFGGLPGALGAIGGQMVDGLVGGLRDAWGGLTSTLHDLAMGLPKPIRDALGIASPSKVFHLIGTQVGQGLHKGLLGSVDQIKDASTKLADAVMGDKRWKGTALGSRMVAGVMSVTKKLAALSTRRDKAQARLDTDTGALADLRTQRSDFAASVKSGVLANAGVSSIFGDSMQSMRDARQTALDTNAVAQATTMGAGVVTLNGSKYQPSWTTTQAAAKVAVPKMSAHAGLLAVKAGLKTLLADTKKFRANLVQLAKLGIDPYTYDELVQAGVRGGALETSNALLADKSLAKSIFGMERQVATAGGQLGTTTSNREFAGRIGDAKDAIAADKADLHSINVTMVVEAKKIDEVDKLVRMVKHVRTTARKKKKARR